jgi:hypothetical protein
VKNVIPPESTGHPRRELRGDSKDLSNAHLNLRLRNPNFDAREPGAELLRIQRRSPAERSRHRRRRCATRTNEGTLKGTRHRLFFAADGPPALGAGTPRHAALASKIGARATRISASNRGKRSLIAGSSRRYFPPIHHASKEAANGIGWR